MKSENMKKKPNNTQITSDAPQTRAREVKTRAEITFQGSVVEVMSSRRRENGAQQCEADTISTYKLRDSLYFL